MLIAGQRGVTLIELMIAVAVVTLLLALGTSSFSLWLKNSQTRSAAEAVQNGLQLARAEAVKRNSFVRFELTDSTGQIAWNVGCVTVTSTPDCPATIQSRTAAEGGGNARVGISTVAIPVPAPAGQYANALAAGSGLPAGVTFDGFGRVPTANIGSDLARIDVTNAASAAARRLVITVGSGGQVRMCDPALQHVANAQGC
jgi:type IV fimbrial biogenesis protein FimT